MKRREDEVELEEIESGEINLIPYLDIVTNLMLFLLASVSAGFLLGQINTTLPNYSTAATAPTADPSKPPDQVTLNLVVSATPSGIILWSMTGLEGTLETPKARIPRAPQTKTDEAPHYDYAALNAALYEIAARRYKGQTRLIESKKLEDGTVDAIRDENYEIILQVDAEIPYETVVAIMDAVRRRIPPGARKGHKLPEVTMPRAELQGDKWVPTEPYDPDRHFLFPNVLFGKWNFQ